MNSKPTLAAARRTNAPGGAKSSVVVVAIIAGMLIISGAVAYKIFESSPLSPAPAAPPAEASSPVQPQLKVQNIAPREEVAPAAAAPVAEAPKPVAPAPRPEPSPAYVDSHQLVSTVISLDTNGISAEDAQRWKASLQQLVRQGASSVPAIQDYLAQNLDVNFADVPGADQLGYSSLRAGLLDALGQIGGPESTAAMLQIMQTSVYPTDIATLAATLQEQAPGQYDAQVLSAVRSQLALGAQDQLGNANVAPLFQLLSAAAANGTDVTADLAQYGGKWPYYATIELSNLPNGTGIPSLVQLAQQDSGPGQNAAAQSLAEMAPQNSQAMTALLNMAQQGQLTDSELAQLAPYLAGRENELGTVDNPPGTTTQSLHLAAGNQDFVVADQLNAMTPSQVTQSLSVINQLLQTIPDSDTQAQQALQAQKSILTGRQAK